MIQQHSPSAPFTALRPLPQTARGPYIIHFRYSLPHLAPNAQTALTRPQVSTNTTYGPTLTPSSCWFPYYNLTLFGAYNLTFDYRYLSYSKPRHTSQSTEAFPVVYPDLSFSRHFTFRPLRETSSARVFRQA